MESLDAHKTQKVALTLVRDFSSVQFSRSVMSDFVTPWTAAHQASLSITNSWRLLKLMPIESVMPSSHLILCRLLLLLPPIPPKRVAKFLCQLIFQANKITNIWSNNDKYTGSSAHYGQTGYKKMCLTPMAFAQEVWKNWKGLKCRDMIADTWMEMIKSYEEDSH